MDTTSHASSGTISHAALQAIYGLGASAQRRRYDDALAQFLQRYGPGPVIFVRAPGRVNLIGEHTDYNHGYVLPVALDRDALLLARPRPDGQVRLANVEPDFPQGTFETGRDIPSAPAGDWSNYARGPAQELSRQMGRAIGGMDVLVSGGAPFGVPRGAGLSSSSALTVAFAVAFAHICAWPGSDTAMAQLCSDAEWYVGTRGGIMDQYIALMAARGHALFLDCRPDGRGRFRTESLPLPPDYRLLVIDSRVPHSNTRNEFNQRVAACRAGVALLRAAHPGMTHLRDVEAVDWPLLAPLLPARVTLDELQAANTRLGDLPNVAGDVPLRVRACCRHVWQENRRVLAAADALRAGDVERLGQLLVQAHASARDDYAISTPELDFLVNAAGRIDGVAGARLTGAGWGGCVIALVADWAVADFRERIARGYEQAFARSPEIFACQAGPGAGVLGLVDAK